MSNGTQVLHYIPSYPIIKYMETTNTMEVFILPSDEIQKALNTGKELFEIFGEVIGAERINVIDFTDDLCLIIDDAGLSDATKPVYELTLHGVQAHAAGMFAFGRTVDCHTRGGKIVPLQLADYKMLKELSVHLLEDVQ